MKRLKIVFSIAMISVCTLAFSQDKGELLAAIGSGNVAEISTYIDDSVEICIFDDQNLYDKQEGIGVLTSFYTDHPSAGFNKMHAGNNDASSNSYTIGNLKTSTGDYRVFVYTDQVDGKLVLQELRISRK